MKKACIKYIYKIEIQKLMFRHSIVNEQSIYDVYRNIRHIVQSACNALWSL